MDDDDFFGPEMLLADGSIESVISENPSLAQAIAAFDGFHSAEILGGLLTVPELQCNCHRLETLIHLALAVGDRRKRPTKTSIASWFEEAGAGTSGRMEDPAEDAFVTAVTTQRGTFRVLEGIWESAGFYLQRLLNVVDGMPDEGDFRRIKRSTHALLQLSDLICERSGLHRYTFGASFPRASLSRTQTNNLKVYAQRVTFSTSELVGASISLDDLRAFTLDRRYFAELRQSTISLSPLTCAPLISRDRRVTVALPTAISVAVRLFVVGVLNHGNRSTTLCRAIAHEYAEYFRSNPPFRTPKEAPIAFRVAHDRLDASYGLEVDAGRFIQFLFVADSLDEFHRTGLASPPNASSDSSTLDKDIDDFRAEVSQNAAFKEGLTVVIGCGIGRPQLYALSADYSGNWHVLIMSAPDVATLSALNEVTPLTLFRMVDAQSTLAARNVRFLNVGGPLNLFAWIRSLDGSLVPHSDVPDDVRDESGLRIILHPALVKDIRQESTEKLDRHSAPTVEGTWKEVRRFNDSDFEEDHKVALYFVEESDDSGHLPFVFETSKRYWWCKVRRSDGYESWKRMKAWLPKVAIVLDRELPLLPSRLLLTVAFEDRRDPPEADCTVTFAEIKSGMSYEADVAHSRVAVVADSRFHVGLGHAENIAEAALVEAIVDGFLALIGKSDSARAADLRTQIVPNTHARDSHSFQARKFRDFVHAAIRQEVVEVDEIDRSSLHLKLGSTARQIGRPVITGKSDCTTFLNSVVAAAQTELFAQMRQFNRLEVLELALRNHEAAVFERDVWRRTAAANLALHENRAATAKTLAQRESELSGVILGSRLISEIANCECAIEGGATPGKLDLSRMLASVQLIHIYGGWSDAIHFDAMAPTLSIAPLGVIHADLSFFDSVVVPFCAVNQENMLESSVSGYADNFRPPITAGEVERLFEPEFIAAWKDELGASLDDFRKCVDLIEDFAIERGLAVMRCRRSDIVALCEKGVRTAAAILLRLTMPPRPNWFAISPFNTKDCRLWRFKRHLSLLRLPIIQVNDEEDPLQIVAPGMLRDAVNYMARCYHEGSFPHYQFRSRAMRAWSGRSADKRGKDFGLMVAKELKQFGWKVETEVSVKKILRARFAIDYGDVDVLAYDESRRRILLIECKDLHFHKTAGELAEQLRDFRGATTEEGGRDELRRHLDRCEVLTEHRAGVLAYLKACNDARIETWVVFRNPVPMLFAWREFENRVGITTFDRLREI